MRSHLRTSPTIWRPAYILSGILIPLALSGCSRSTPNAPISETAESHGVFSAAGAPRAGAFFPLGIGSRWHATADNHLRVEPAGGGPPTEELSTHSDIVRTLIGTEILSGRSYVVQEEVVVQTGDVVGPEPQTFTSWLRYRQDKAGLYEADVATNQPPSLENRATPRPVDLQESAATARARRPLPAAFAAKLSGAQRHAYQAAWDDLQVRADVIRSLFHRSVAAQSGGVLPEELTRLSYPLHPQAAWVVRGDPLFTSTVEKIESLEVPAGKYPSYRIRVDNEFLHSGDFVHIWFGRSGQLAFRYHIVGIATDVNGNEIGRLVFDYDEVLEDLALVRG